MNDETKEILDKIIEVSNVDDYEDCFIGTEFKPLINYITNLQKENERLNTELNSYKDEFCKDAIKKYELVMEKEYYKSNCKKAIEYININKKEITQNQADFYDGKNKLKVGTFMWNVDELLEILGGDE